MPSASAHVANDGNQRLTVWQGVQQGWITSHMVSAAKAAAWVGAGPSVSSLLSGGSCAPGCRAAPCCSAWVQALKALMMTGMMPASSICCRVSSRLYAIDSNRSRHLHMPLTPCTWNTTCRCMHACMHQSCMCQLYCQLSCMPAVLQATLCTVTFQTGWH